ncbi:MAG: D-arabinono-1,4-lactone oxidase [Thalassotalea sp.]
MALLPDRFGFYHPSNENELIKLVKKAKKENKNIRTCGAAHSQSWAIYTSDVTEEPNVTNREIPPVTDDYNVILDQMMTVTLLDKTQRIVRAQAGVHLGYDPSDVTGMSTQKNSLLYQLWHNYDLTLSEVGGIIHQTLGGFMSTGSAGGSLKYSFQDNIIGIRFINGHGELVEAKRDDKQPELFFAVMVSMGLFGIVVSVDLQCEVAFNIFGQEATVEIEECAFDFFGEDNNRPSMLDFFKDIDYGRVNWWPQAGAQRILPWQAQRIKPVVGFTPSPYQEFTNFPDIAEPFINIIYVVLGNLDAPELIPEKIQTANIQLEKVINQYFGFEDLEPILGIIFDAILAEKWSEVIALIQLNVTVIKEQLPELMVCILNIFQPLDSKKKGMDKGNPQVFQDYAPWGLPMDNQASDELLDIEFTELWFPVSRTSEVVQVLRDYFNEEVEQARLKRTGLFTIEVYMAKACEAWMAMGYSNGDDEWKDGAVRFEPLWFVDFFEDPQEVFYPQFWRLFRDKGIDFRLHWGKMLPNILQGDPEGWAQYMRKQYPKWDEFLSLRAKMDPQQIFVSEYWRKQLMIT